MVKKIGIQEFKKGDKTKVFVSEEHYCEVEMIGTDNCSGRHPIWRVISDGPIKGKEVRCGDVVYP